MRSEKIVILGTGYVGFPLAVILARSGFKVVGVDIKREVVRGINSGNLPIREKEIEAIFKEPAVRKNLVASDVSPGVLTDTTADFAFALLMAAGRRVAEGDRALRRGEFHGWGIDTLLGQDLHGATLGLVGVGIVTARIRRRRTA